MAQVPAPPGAASPPVSSADGKAAYVIEQQHERVRFERDGTGRRELTLRVKVLDEQAVRAWGQLPFAYNSDSETLELSRIEVRKGDGSVVATPPSAVQDVAVKPFPQLPIFMDVRQKVPAVVSLRPGDTLVIEAAWIVTRALTPGHFVYAHSFNRAEPVQDERLEIDVPADKTVLVKTEPTSPVEQGGGRGLVADGRRRYHWTFSNPVPSKDKQDAGEDSEGRPDVRVSTFTTWDEVGRWYRGLIPSVPDPRVAAKADELTKGLTDRTAKIDAIYTFVATQVRYVGLSFGIGRYQPHPAAEVLTNQFGDCKDKQALLGALLAAAGIEAVPVLVSSTRSAQDEFPSPLEFDHLIAVVPTGAEREWLWLDSTTEVAPIGMLLHSLRGHKALFVGDSRTPGRLVTLPLDPPFESFARIDIEATVDAIGVLHSRGTLTMRGDEELVSRAALRSVPRENWSDVGKFLAAAFGVEGQIQDVDAGDPADFHKPLALTFTWRNDRYMDWTATKSEVKVPIAAAHLRGWTDAERSGQQRLVLGSPSKFTAHTSLTFPAGYALQAPVPVTTKADGFSYRSSYAVSGPQFTAEQEMARTARTLPASAFSAYAAFAAAVDADRAQPLKVAATISGTPAIPANATATAVYNAALSAYNAKRYEAAAALWKRTTEIDPKMGDAWVSLGLVYEKLERDDEAAAAIQKQIELDPYNKRAYGDLGYVLKQAGKDEEAIKAYAKHVELNPVDGDAFTELGTLQEEHGRFAEAAPALEKATALGKPNAWTLVLLGNAYLRLNKRENALQAFDRAVALEGSPRVWTKIGWSLADTGIELERAADLASRTLARVSDETRSLTLESARNRHLYFMGNLAWAWDTLGLVNLQKGNLADADKYSRAAWLLDGHWQMAEHVGRIYEKQGRQAEALNYYLTAKAEAPKSGPSLAARTTALTKDTTSDTLTRVARTMSLYRMALVEEKGINGEAHFVAIVGEDQHAIDVKFVDGDAALERLGAALKRVTYPVEFPTPASPRLILPLAVRCELAAGCAMRIARRDDVDLERK